MQTATQQQASSTADFDRLLERADEGKLGVAEVFRALEKRRITDEQASQLLVVVEAEHR